MSEYFKKEKLDPNKKVTIVIKEKPICCLYTPFGTCPFTIEDVENSNISYKDMKKANRECCKTHRQPNNEELKQMFGSSQLDGGKQ